ECIRYANQKLGHAVVGSWLAPHIVRRAVGSELDTSTSFEASVGVTSNHDRYVATRMQSGITHVSSHHDQRVVQHTELLQLVHQAGYLSTAISILHDKREPRSG